jgi:hypothetical protein
MSLNCNAASQDCYYECCDVNAQCPSTSTKCYYFYDESGIQALSAGAIIGIVLAGIFVILLIAGIVWWCQRRNRLMEQATINASNGEIPATTVVLPNNDLVMG